jgi:hypothetical protein
MINAEPQAGQASDTEDAAVDTIIGNGVTGAKMLAGLATGIVVGLWIAFYLLVFLPRSVSP